MLLSLLAVLNIAAASSSDHKGLKGEPFSGIVSKSASTIDLQATFLTEGYVTTASYVDSGCKALSSADSYLLNNCYKEAGKYLKYTATATSIISTSYSDANCNTVLVAEPPSDYTDACTGSKKKYISPTTKIPSITPVALQMLVHAIDGHSSL